MGYDDRIEKSLSELPEDLSFRESTWTKNWGYGKWDYANYAISNVLEDGTEHRYRLPSAIGEIIERERQKGKEEAQEEMRRALGL